MNRTVGKVNHTSPDHLAQYVQTVDGMHQALQRIFVNKRAIGESLTRTAASLRAMSMAGKRRSAASPPG